MLLKSLAAVLVAFHLGAAGPSKRQSGPNLHVSLTNVQLAVTHEYNASTDGTAVLVDPDIAWDEARLGCLEICIPEYHCTLYDKAYTPFLTLPPGLTRIQPASQVGLIICGSGLPADRK